MLQSDDARQRAVLESVARELADVVRRLDNLSRALTVIDERIGSFAKAD